MELVRGLSGSGRRGEGCVLTIGTYDGIHLGHQALLARLHEHAARRGAAAVLLTFEPTPREYLAPNDPPPRLTSLRERWRILSGAGLDYLWLLRFGEAGSLPCASAGGSSRAPAWITCGCCASPRLCVTFRVRPLRSSWRASCAPGSS